MNKELRTFKLVDKEGYLNNHHHYNSCIISGYLEDGCLTGIINPFGHLYHGYDKTTLITSGEFKYFEEVLSVKDNNTDPDTQTPSKTPSQPLQGTFSDETIHCIIEDCKALDASLWFDKDSVVLLWNEDEYVIESVEDYHTIVGALKMIQTFRKV